MPQEDPPGAPSVTVSAPPAVPSWTVSTRQRDPTMFAGLPSEDVDDWLDNYDRVSESNRWDDSHKLRSVAFYLTDVARTWFLNHERSFPDWAAFRHQLRQIFGAPNVRSEVAKKKLDARMQLPGETYTSYIEDVLALCRRVDAAMTESDRVRHILKGIAHVAFNALAIKNPNTVNDVIATCQHLDALQAIRLQPVACDTPPSSDTDLRVLIRTLIREELQVYGLRSPPVLQPQPSVPGLRDIIKEELSSMTCTVGCVPPSPAPSYAQVAAMQPAFVQTTPPAPVTPNHLATLAPRAPATAYYPTRPSPRPICYYCGIRGHISRFCRRRQQDERRGYDVYERDTLPLPSPYQRRLSQRSLTPPPNPEEPRNYRPGRRRSPSPLRRSTSPLLPASRTPDYRSEN